MVETVGHVRVSQEYAITNKGCLVHPCQLEVIDLKTGECPVDCNGVKLEFIEVDAVAGFGLTIDGEVIIGKFELRVLE